MTREVFDQIVNECLDNVTTTQLTGILKRELQRKLFPAIQAHIKDLQYHRDTTVGLWATDKEPDNKELFFQIA